MLKKVVFENILKSKTAIGLEIVLLPDSAFEINVVVLKKNKSLISSEKQIKGIKDIAELTGQISNKLPLILIFSGKGIIHRKVVLSEHDTQVTLLNKVLPNANVNDFYIQQAYAPFCIQLL